MIEIIDQWMRLAPIPLLWWWLLATTLYIRTNGVRCGLTYPSADVK